MQQFPEYSLFKIKSYNEVLETGRKYWPRSVQEAGAQGCVRTSVIPIKVRKEGAIGPQVEMLKESDLWETVGKTFLDSLMEVKPIRVLCWVDCSHQQGKEEDLY